MPVYEYLCEKCGHEFEREQRITEDPIKTCPACRGRRVKKLISQTSFVLKGGGWYSDLYSSASDKKGDKASDATDSKESDKKDSGTKTSSGDSDSSKTSKKTKDKKPSKSKGSST